MISSAYSEAWTSATTVKVLFNDGIWDGSPPRHFP
jgi:hypothetical protein